MSAPIPYVQPSSVNAGDTAKWLVNAPDYPATQGWVLTVTLVSATARYTITSSAFGDDFLVSAAATATALWAPNRYQTRTQVAKAGEVYTIAEGSITVAPSFGAAVDARTQARRMLDAVEATLEGRATSDVQQYEIAGRRLAKIPIPELLVLRDRLRVDVRREEDAQRGGLGPRGRVHVRFGA